MRSHVRGIMKNKTAILILLFLVLALCLTACNSGGQDIDGKVKVTFVLEGGTYKNSDRPVNYYFGFEKGTQNLIKDMFDTQSGYALTRIGYVVEGWYKTKTQTGTDEHGNAVYSYSDKWNFATDKVGDEGVTLYANWKPAIKYTYQICWKNGDGTEVKIGSPYEVDAGKPFVDTFGYVTGRSTKPNGYTFLKFVDENGNDWDNSFVHPGGDTDCEIKVYADYIEGDWTLVRTKSELKSASKKATANIYLLGDVDMEGDALNFGNFANRKFNGNGYSVSNFAINYDASKNGLVTDVDGTPNVLYISLFGNTSNSVITDVNFTNVTLDVKTTFAQTSRIYSCPLCVNVTNSTIKNVKVYVNFTVTSTPWDAVGQETAKDENFVQYQDLSNGFFTMDDTSMASYDNVAILPSN